MKALLSLFVVFAAATASAANCADLVGTPEFWKCIAENSPGQGGNPHMPPCPTIYCLNHEIAGIAASANCSHLVNNPPAFWQCIAENSPGGQ